MVEQSAVEHSAVEYSAVKHSAITHADAPGDAAEPSELVDAVRALTRLSRLVERASDELSGADYRVMAQIVAGEARASRLAARLALGKPAISSSIDSLSRRGLIVKSSVEGDNRAIQLTLSDEGAELFARMEARMVRQLELLAERTPEPARTIEALNWLGDVIEASMVAHFEQVTGQVTGHVTGQVTA